jgi:Kef-type K+ transport system membrane component KefB
VTGIAILLVGAAIAYGAARWLDATAVPFLVLAGVALARLGVFPMDRLRETLVLGLTFLVFVAGLELSPSRTREQRVTALKVGLLQFFALGTLGFGVAILLAQDPLTAVYLGLALAASSTLLVVRLLQRRRQLYEPVGKLVVGVLLLQDLLIILMIPLLTQATNGVLAVLRGIGGTVALVALAYACLRVVSPRLAALRMEPEVLLLAALGVLACFIGLADWLDLPLAAGAFLAGVALSSFPVRDMIRGQLGPVSDFFSAIFFIALGGLLDPPGARGLLVALVFALLVMVVTPPLVTMIAERAGFSARSALESGLLLAQTSELSLVLALQGYLAAGQLTQEVFTMVAITTVITMVLTPWLSSESVVQRLMRLQPIRRTEPGAAPPRDHVLLLGCGAGGMPLLETLFAAGHEVVVIDDDPEVVDRLRRGDVKCIRGDAAELQALIEAGAQHALIISSTIRRPRDNQRLLQNIHGPTVLVRVFEDEDADWVRDLGGTPVVYSAAAAEDFFRWFDRTYGGATSGREAGAAPALSRADD